MTISIYSNTPQSGETGVSTFSYLQVVFTTACDTRSVGQGSLFLEGPDHDYLSGPYTPLNYPGTSLEDVFQSPDYKGIVQGTYDYDYVETDGTTPYTPSGTSMDEEYYSRVTFYPTKPLSPVTPYVAYVIGTSSDQTATDVTHPGISRRTVFDPMADVANVGDGNIYTYGGNTAAGTHLFEVQMLSTGVVGFATYKWKRDSDSYSASIRSHSYARALRDGVSVAFSGSGTFQVGDKFTFYSRQPEWLSGYNYYNFVTGERGSSLVVGTTTSLLSTVAPPPVSQLYPGLSLAYTYPASPSCNISESRTSFTFYFNKALDTTFLSTEGIEIYIGPPDGDTTVRTETTYNVTSWTAVGSALTVYL